MKTLGSIYRNTSLKHKLNKGNDPLDFSGQVFGKSDIAGAKKAAPASATPVEMMQRRQLASADADRKVLEQERAAIGSSSRLRKRGRGLTAYAGGLGA